MRFVMKLATSSILVLALRTAACAREPVALKTAAPELKGIENWINSKPLTLKELRGKVVVLHFWTFGCINCVHNYPWYAGWHKDFSEKGLVIVGVHTPETDGEKNIERVRQKVKDHKIKYAVAEDSAGKTWKAWGNQFWPSVYLIDKKGYVRYRWDGELNWKEVQGEKQMRRRIEQLLAERESMP